MVYQVFAVEYMSYEGNYRTSDVVFQTEDTFELSESFASSEYHANSGAYGDSSCTMISATLQTICETREALDEYCDSNNIFPDIIEV